MLARWVAGEDRGSKAIQFPSSLTTISLQFFFLICRKSGVGRLASLMASEKSGRRSSLQDGLWRDLLTVRGGEAAREAVVGRLYRAAGHDRSRAERGIVFLDGLDAPGQRSMDYGEDASRVGEEVLREVAEVVGGAKVEVEAEGEEGEGGEGRRRVTLDTRHMFFICFGVRGDLVGGAAAAAAAARAGEDEDEGVERGNAKRKLCST